MTSRAILCPNDATEDHKLDLWSPDQGNYWWRPKTESRYPKTALLLPGDILLFRPLTPSLLQREIVRYQREQCRLRGRSEAHAEYTHAAIFVGYDGLLCEAVLGGVQLNSLDDKLEDCCIAVRRAPGLMPEQRCAIARGAVEHRNTRYGWKELLAARFGLESLSERLIPSVEGPEAADVKKSLICSTLCSRALLRGGVSVLPPDRGLVTPAWLSAGPQLGISTFAGLGWSPLIPACN